MLSKPLSPCSAQSSKPLVEAPAGLPVLPGSSITFAGVVSNDVAMPFVYTAPTTAALSKLPALTHTVFRSVALRPQRPQQSLFRSTLFTAARSGDGDVVGVSSKHFSEDAVEELCVRDGNVLSASDVLQGLPVMLRRASGRPLVVGTDTLGVPVTDDDIVWWLALVRSPGAMDPFLHRAPSTFSHLRRTLSAAALRARTALPDAALPHSHSDAAPVVAVGGAGGPGHAAAHGHHRRHPRRRAHSAVTASRRAAPAVAASGPHKPSAPPRKLDVPTAMSMNAYPVAKALWHVLKRLPDGLSSLQRRRLPLSGVPLITRVQPVALAPSEVPTVRRVRLRVKADAAAGAAANAFIFNPLDRRGARRKGVGSHFASLRPDAGPCPPCSPLCAWVCSLVTVRACVCACLCVGRRRCGGVGVPDERGGSGDATESAAHSCARQRGGGRAPCGRGVGCGGHCVRAARQRHRPPQHVRWTRGCCPPPPRSPRVNGALQLLPSLSLCV